MSKETYYKAKETYTYKPTEHDTKTQLKPYSILKQEFQRYFKKNHEFSKKKNQSNLCLTPPIETKQHETCCGAEKT